MSSVSETLLRRSLDRIRRDVRTHGLWRPGDRLLLGCSAGIDSTVAWALLAQLEPSLGHRLEIAHVEHGLRADADAVDAALDAMQARFGHRLRRLSAPVEPGPQLESRARAARYAALQTAAAGATVVTAHHADDQAETVAMRLFRGAGSEALAAARWRRADGVVRPLLGLDRATLAGLGGALGLRWVDDPGNVDRTHERNRWRHDLLPAIEAVRPGAARNLVRATRHAADAGAAAARLADALVEAVGSEHAAAVVLPRAALPADAATLWHLLAAVARRLQLPAPGHDAAAQLVALLARGGDGHADFSGMFASLTDQIARFEARHVAHPGCADYLAEGGGPAPYGAGRKVHTAPREPTAGRPPGEPIRSPS
ncbi:MAG: hypothetical protein RIT45_109 [Pseudomonadota bacterium]|jgi:tRNA(Ile)-lysidine synthase